MIYKEQFDRVKRFLARIENQNRDHTDYADDLWSFFQQCWHLNDWIKNDPELTIGDVWNDVKKIHSIMICRDLANRSKHLTLNYEPEMDAQVTQARLGIEAAESLQDETAHDMRRSNKYTITLHKTGSQKDALQVAQEAVKDWAALLKRNGLT